MLTVPSAIAATVIVICSLLTFVPSRYLYATRGGPFAAVINVGAPIWFLALAVALMDRTPRGHLIAQVSFAYPATYMALSAVVEQRERNREGAKTRSVRR